MGCSLFNRLLTFYVYSTVHYRVHNSKPPVPILCQINPNYSFLYYVFKIHFNIVTTTTGSSQLSPSFRCSCKINVGRVLGSNLCYLPRSSHDNSFNYHGYLKSSLVKKKSQKGAEMHVKNKLEMNFIMFHICK
jgi:hypothetical protein